MVWVNVHIQYIPQHLESSELRCEARIWIQGTLGAKDRSLLSMHRLGFHLRHWLWHLHCCALGQIPQHRYRPQVNVLLSPRMFRHCRHYVHGGRLRRVGQRLSLRDLRPEVNSSLAKRFSRRTFVCKERPVTTSALFTPNCSINLGKTSDRQPGPYWTPFSSVYAYDPLRLESDGARIVRVGLGRLIVFCDSGHAEHFIPLIAFIRAQIDECADWT